MTQKLSGQALSKIVFSVTALVFFGVTLWLLVADKAASGSVAAGVGAIVLCLANLDRIESIKGFGMEAKTRDLRQAIEEAEGTIAKLEAMSVQLKAQADSIEAMQSQLDETKTTAQRAKAIAFMNM